MDIFIISLRTIIMFIAVFIFFRLSGKKDLGEISVLDIIVSLMVAELSASIIEKPDLPLSFPDRRLPLQSCEGQSPTIRGR
ncbi:hypothetical protein BALCAV_0220215 [Alkalihalobacillus alcalophilus ATCC 27647 = CGMCC 1.3604]|uniref:DUF421 domain-containing protein n=1 Tax=Alkalihalobacillus alcalophilus ATCC 27647 = CGMCC 1.3604 TaxID=1218173 RepID=A0A094WGA2_ALKAL|nr:hypothetical protein [Alkalihalobacillus alcalophilus]KGA95806.1 hypothetical protein BALCAV_0220215 [Alkalihalobacillus alcalophilus ATCC 27647 = CGMCC 1.3604]